MCDDHCWSDLISLMRARECGKLFRSTSHYLTCNPQVFGLASEARSEFGASLLRRFYSTNPGQAKVNVLKRLVGGKMPLNVTCVILQFCCWQAPAGSPSFSTFASGQLGKNSSTCPNAADFAVRRLATATASPNTSQKLQETAKGKMQRMLAGPTTAVQSAKQSVRNTTNAVYKQMPRPVSLSQCICTYHMVCDITLLLLSTLHNLHTHRLSAGSPQWASQVACNGLSPSSLKHSGRPTDGRSLVQQQF